MGQASSSEMATDKATEKTGGGSGERGLTASNGAPRKRYELDDRGFDEVPVKYRKFYRRWDGPDDVLAPNEALCPVCKIIIRSPRELRAGDRLYCMACMTRVRIVAGEDGRLETETIY